MTLKKTNSMVSNIEMGAIHHPFYLFIYNTESFFNNTERVEKDNLNIIFSTESF